MASVQMILMKFLPLLALLACLAAPTAAVSFSGKVHIQVNSAGTAREQRTGATKSLMRKDLHSGRAEETESAWTAESVLSALDDSVLIPISTLDAYGKTPGSPNAVVTLICNDRWVPGALALAASLRKTGLKADSVLMLGSDVSKHYHEVLKANFDHVYQQEVLRSHPSITRVNADCLTLQLRTWELPYKKALFMDADMIVLKNPDRLFLQYGELTAKMDQSGEFNGGMFMCEPSARTFGKLRAGLSLYKGTPGRHGMQQFLNHMYPKCKSAEPITQTFAGTTAGCMGSTFSGEHNKFSRLLEPQEAAAMVQGNSPYDSVHFSGDWETEKKPWMKGCMMNASSTTKFDGATRDNILNLWKQAYDGTKQPANGTHFKPEIECPFFNCGTARGTMDFVVHADKLDCVAKSAIAAVLKYAAPRRVLLVAPESECRKCFISKVQCVDHDSLVPSISQQRIKAWIRAKHGNCTKEDAREAMARKFFHQFLRIGLVEASDRLALSDEYVLFDAETLLIRDFCPYNKAGQVTFMEGDEEKDYSCQSHYAAVFEDLTGVAFAFSKNHRSYNAHLMVISRNIMKEFLRTIEERHPAEDHWSSAMLKHMCTSSGDCACGFPDLASYASWMRSQHPDKFAESGQLYRLWHPAPWQFRAKKEKACCPEVYDFTAGNLELGMGHQFVRWDRNCKPLNWKMMTKPNLFGNATRAQREEARAEAKFFSSHIEGSYRSPGAGANQSSTKNSIASGRGTVLTEATVNKTTASKLGNASEKLPSSPLSGASLKAAHKST
mmetsp:Transcript_80099/g.141825  ORF Transcript_80099/g.141825 Transcript_80099/m.141825 type:complete len:781 (+) Transcript_80099:39-2381(+)